VLKFQPGNTDALEVLAEARLALGSLEPSAEHFEKLAQLDAQNPKVWYGLGLAYQGLAQQNFDQLAKVAPGSAYWLDLVGESRLKVLQYNSAFFFYRQALAKMPSIRGVHAAVAEVYKNTGHADWASVEEQKESQLPPPDCSAQTLECDFQAGRYSDLVTSAAGLKTPESFYWRTRAYNQLTLQAFARLGELPPSAELHELMAKVKSDQREYHDSAQEWQEALKLSPGNPYIRKQLALSLIKNKDLEGARSILQDLVKQTPDSPELNYMLGDTLLNLQKAEEAIPCLKKAVTGDPHLLAAHSSLARAYLQIGDAQKALPHLKAALPIDEDGSLHYQLARAYQSSGQAELAKSVLKDYQEIVKASAAEDLATAQEVQISPPE
jgi:predicted Zn-dependent protease